MVDSNATTSIWENDNDDILGNLLNTAKTIPEISEYLSQEIIYLKDSIEKNSSIIDFGCGDGRHLRSLEKNISNGLGIDMNSKYLNIAKNKRSTAKIEFTKSNIENFRSTKYFDYSISMYNTLGVVSDQKGLITSMISSVKPEGVLILSLYSLESIPYRVSMYKAMGFKEPRIKGNIITVENGLFSRHYSREDIEILLPDAAIMRCTAIGWYVEYRKI